MKEHPFLDFHTHIPHSSAEYILAYSIGIDEPPADGERFCAGIHPWQVDSVDRVAALEYLKNAPMVAVGEIGLDYLKNDNRELQRDLFESQLDIAQRRELPVVIHCVRAYNDVLEIIRDRAVENVIFHAYIGSPQQTRTIVERGYYISLNKMSLGSRKTVESIRDEIPLDRVFMETDMGGDYVIRIEDVYAEFADIVDITIDHLKEIVWANHRKIFKQI